MPAVARGDAVDAVVIVHPTCQGSTETRTRSDTVFVNGIGVHRLGDFNQPHTIRIGLSCPLHTTPIVKASETVYANGQSVARIGDVYSCSARVLTGSENVFAN